MNCQDLCLSSSLASCFSNLRYAMKENASLGRKMLLIIDNSQSMACNLHIFKMWQRTVQNMIESGSKIILIPVNCDGVGEALSVT